MKIFFLFKLKNSNLKKNLKFLYKTLKSNFFIFFTLLFIIISIALLETTIIGSLSPIVKIIEDENYIKIFYNQVFQKKSIVSYEKFEDYFFISLGFIFILSAVMNIASFYVSNKMTVGLNFLWKNQIINRYFYKDINFFNKNFTGDLIQKINIHTQNASFVIYYFALILKEIVIVISIYILLLTISIPFTLGISVFFLIIFLLTSIIGKYYILKKTHVRNEAQKKIFNYTNIILNGIKIIKLFNKQQYFSNKFFNFSNIQKNIDIKTQTLVNYPAILVRTLTFISLIFLVYSSVNGLILITDTSLLIIYIAAAYKINNCIGSINNGILNTLSIFPSVHIVRKEITNPKKEKNKKNTYRMFKNSINLKNINYSYPESSLRIFNNLNFKIKKNKFYIIYGPSGSGKSTFADLISGFLKFKGKISIDSGKYLSPVDFNQNLISYANQNAILFPGSIVSNITLFDKATDRARLNKVIQICKINKLVSKNTNGKKLFESGNNLSGGQKQRVCLARTLYSDRDIILLDESISNVEKKLEREIMLNIKKYAKEKFKTIIVITHSNHYLDLADEVYQLNQGKMKLKKIF